MPNSFPATSSQISVMCNHITDPTWCTKQAMSNYNQNIWFSQIRLRQDYILGLQSKLLYTSQANYAYNKSQTPQLSFPPHSCEETVYSTQLKSDMRTSTFQCFCSHVQRLNVTCIREKITKYKTKLYLTSQDISNSICLFSTFLNVGPLHSGGALFSQQLHQTRVMLFELTTVIFPYKYYCTHLKHLWTVSRLCDVTV